MKRNLLILSVLVLLFPIACRSEEKIDRRPENWAVTVQSDKLENLYKVTENFYRSAQPTAEGMAELKKMGIKTVINLRNNHNDDEEIKDTGMEAVHIPINTWHMKDEYVVKFLKIATDPAKQPILLHCLHGSDRTGTMSAMYRITVQGWSREDAVREMKEGGFGYHKLWINLIKYIRNADIEKIKKEAGI